MEKTREYAYAKINLTLDVTEKRADGFHNIESIMHSLSLSDELTVELWKSENTEINLIINGNDSLPTDGRNLVVKAAKAYLEKIGESAKINMTLVKRIPSSAGLGGGSSDAAATLRALNRIFDGRLSSDELSSLGALLGSDVPYCIVGGTALCRGRGEILSEINTAAKGAFVVAIGEDGVSTPRAYAELDRIYSDFKDYSSVGKDRNERMIKSLLDGKISASCLYNIFEDAVIKNCPSVEKIKEVMLSAGALGALMSGSGPSVFGLFENSNAAKEAAEKLSQMGYRAFFAESV